MPLPPSWAGLGWNPFGTPSRTSPGGSLTPAGSSNYTPAYGGTPQVPNPLGSAGGAISGNIGNLAGLYNLGVGTSGASAAAAVQPFLQNLPGYQSMVGQSSANIGSLLRGEVPDDVRRQIGQLAAERGAATGIGSAAPNSNAALLRALGLTSLGLQGQGEQELSGAVARTPTGPAFDPNRFLITPQQLFEAQLGANIYGAAPNPASAAAAAEATALRGFGAGRGGAGPTVSGMGPPLRHATTPFETQPAPAVFGQPNFGGGGAAGGTSDWYTQTFGGQQFGGGAQGPGTYYAGSAEGAPLTTDEQGWLDEVLGFGAGGGGELAAAGGDYGGGAANDWSTMGYDPLEGG